MMGGKRWCIKITGIIGRGSLDREIEGYVYIMPDGVRGGIPNSIFSLMKKEG